MSHYANRINFARRGNRWVGRQMSKFSSPDKSAPADLATAGATDSGEGSDSKSGASAGLGARDCDDSHKGNSGQSVVPTAPPCGVTTDTALTGGDTQSQTPTDQQRPTPLSDHSAGGGVLVAAPFIVLAAFDRWATLAVIVVTLIAFAWAIVRVNRSSRPTTPPRRQSASRGNHQSND